MPPDDTLTREQTATILARTLISIDCTAVENDVTDNRFQRSELDYAYKLLGILYVKPWLI